MTIQPDELPTIDERYKDYSRDDLLSEILRICTQRQLDNKTIKDLEAQASSDMECTLDQMLPRDIVEKWGLDAQCHRRNIQHIFMRCCLAISDLEGLEDND